MNNNDIIKLEEALVATGLYGKISAQHLDEATWPQKLASWSRVRGVKFIVHTAAHVLGKHTKHVHLELNRRRSPTAVRIGFQGFAEVAPIHKCLTHRHGLRCR